MNLGKSSHPDPQSRELCALCCIADMTDTPNPYGWRKFNQAMRRLVHHRASPTLTKSQVPGSDLPFAGSARIGDKRAAVIASFPPGFVFAGDWKDAINRIGNSVPPYLCDQLLNTSARKSFTSSQEVPCPNHPSQPPNSSKS